MASILLSVCKPTTPSAEAEVRPRSRTKLEDNATQQKEEDRRHDEQERESTQQPKENCTEERKCTETSESDRERDEVHPMNPQQEQEAEEAADDDDDDALFRCDKDYARVEMIGKGAYGSVFKAKAPSGDLVALKKVRMDSENQGFPITAIREIKILQTLKHRNVIQLRDVVASADAWKCRPESAVFMVFPFMDHDLTGLLENPEVRFSTPQIKYYLMQILEGVHYCHKRRVLHRDIKGPNVLINNMGEVKLADFGLARFRNDDDEQYTSNVVTLWYRPPELLFGAKKYDDSVDMWSVGCVFAEMLTASPAFPGNTEIDQIERIFRLCGSPTKENWPTFNELPGAQKIRMKAHYDSVLETHFQKFGPLAVDLLQKLLQLDPKRRISAAEALNHQYFWTEPLPIDPKNLPKYAQSHEYQARKRRQQRDQQYLQQQHRYRQQQQQQQYYGGRVPSYSQPRSSMTHKRARYEAPQHQAYPQPQYHPQHQHQQSYRPRPKQSYSHNPSAPRCTHHKDPATAPFGQRRGHHQRERDYQLHQAPHRPSHGRHSTSAGGGAESSGASQHQHHQYRPSY